MKPLKTHEIREIFLQHYQDHGHTREKSSSLVPVNDPTLLFTSAGMVQFKDVFTGLEKRSYNRATTAQKCLRAGGKHNDLENVGFTARHHTFFEMLGNFSFGDYFKKDAIRFAWDLVTKKLGVAPERLHITVFREDDEAYDIWHKEIGVPKERLYRFDEKDNFWSAGDVGPCGPCTEIYIDRGEAFNTGNPEMDKMGGDGDRFLEFYNLVFMQYNRDANGTLSPLPKPSVDTGMGLERMASILQNAKTNYDIDLFLPILGAIESLSKQKYQAGMSETSVAMRVIADHLRAMSFLIADGVLPSNEGRGYVLRRILRRAARYGKKLGLKEAFLWKLVPALVETMGSAYPELEEKLSFVQSAIKAEEEKFFVTLEKGLSLLEENLAQVKPGGLLPGSVAFLLYDSFGFPLDLTTVIAKEQSKRVDQDAFEMAMEKQREQSRAAQDGGGTDAKADPLFSTWVKEKKFSTFTGYNSCEGEGKLIAYRETDKGFEAVFDRTPFYAESGGQVGDSGEIFSGATKVAFVKEVKKPLPELTVVKGTLEPGQKLVLSNTYRMATPRVLRLKTASNHSATHLLHWALRKILGTHVKQAGSLVNSDFLRFDFTHFQAMTALEISQLEKLINEKIANSEEVDTKQMNKDAAIESGAIALFGEKYDDDVRVVKIGDFSTELCGGTHVSNSSQIRLFVIASETGIAAGVRRIIAYTGQGALDYFLKKAQLLETVRDQLKVTSDAEILRKLERTLSAEKDLEKKLGQFQSLSAGVTAKELAGKAKELNGTKFVVHNLGDASMEQLRLVAERTRDHLPNGVIGLACFDVTQSKAYLLVSVSPDLVSRYPAGKIIQKIAPHIEGKGGGKPELAQAGGHKREGIDAALKEIPLFC